MKKGCIIPIILLVILAIGGAIGAIYYLWEEEQKGPARFDTESATVETIIDKSVATGAVQPREEVQIKPLISGIVKEIYVEAGDTIKEDQVIAKVRVIPNMSNLNNAQNRLERAKLSLENARKDYERNAELVEQGVISEAEFQQFDLAFSQAQEEVTASKDALNIIEKGVGTRNGSAQNTLVKATEGGMILDVPVKEGNSVIEANNFNEGTTIASIADMNDLIFLGKVDESEVEKLEVGMELILTIGAIEDKTFDAVLEYISPKGVEDNGAIKFEIKAAVRLRPNEFVRAGYSATADVVLAKRENVLSIPEALLQFRGDTVYVEVEVEEDRYEERVVTTGLSDGMMIEVLDGISKDDKIKKWSNPIFE
ncbi:MAG: efflux RND transporter periplasmic adaptor subunit [Flavobacteriales bacterium]|nr:efflux RND transporter periplasmic adaptor subunit [Flavobacteriales bacterium]